MQILLDRLKNDVTRLPAVKALAKIAQSPLQLSLAPYVKPLLTELISFLRKANRPLRQASLTTLNVSSLYISLPAIFYARLAHLSTSLRLTRLDIIESKAILRVAHLQYFILFSDHLKKAMSEQEMQAVLLHKESINSVPVDQVVAAIAQLVSESDLLLTSASLQVGTTFLRCHPSSAAAVSKQLLQPALLLSQSSLLQVCQKYCFSY